VTLPNVVELTDEQELHLTRLLQLVLLGILAYGVVTLNLSVAINAAAALVVTVLPTLIRREFGLYIDVELVLWLTLAVLFHTVGILGPYRTTPWWDVLTHALSAAIVAGIAYAVVLAIDRHSDSIHLPEPFFSAFLFLLVVAFAVLWEVLEFVVSRTSEAMGVESALIVFGVTDIVKDVFFSAVGGLLVVLWGRQYFRGLARRLTGLLWRDTD
jgi:hypothetical protein